MTRPHAFRRLPAAPPRHHARTVATAALAALLVACAAPTRTARGITPTAAATTFVLVRHAEKATDDPRDPALLPAGEQRAKRLAAMLAGVTLRAVYATRFRRTQQTAAPTARMHGLEVRTYDPAGPADAFARQLRTTHSGGTVLVVGHSNTVPALAAALCACTVEPMPETEYGRYYRLTVQGDGPARLEGATW